MSLTYDLYGTEQMIGRLTYQSVFHIYSLGLDTINNVYIKPVMSGGTQTKNIMIVKTQSPRGSKYEFKFSIFTEK